MSNREKTIEKIRKLLALANSSNENEASNANAQAQKLISKFQIEQAEIDSGNKVKQEIVSFTIETGSKSNILWKSRLANTLSEVNNCDFYTQKKQSSEPSKTNPDKTASSYTIYIVIGSKSNVELVQILFELILNQVEYFSKEYIPSEKSRTVGKSEKNSFKLGMVTRIGQRLRDTKEEVLKEHIQLKGSTSAALVFLQQEKLELKTFAVQLFGKIGKAPIRKENIRQEGYKAGFKKGDSVVLNQSKALK